MTEKDTGGAAFPGPAYTQCGHPNGHDMGMTLRDWFAGQAPEPSEEHVNMQRQIDQNRNPYNDAHKPMPRSDLQIRAQYRYEYADAMLEARK